MGLNILRQEFYNNFNMQMVASDLMDLVDEDILFNYIKEEFNSNFMYGELYDLFKNELSKEELQETLEYLGHDFVDLDKLDEEERNNYY